MAALALAMAACSNNDDNEIQQNTQQPGTMHFTATIAAPSGDATTRTVYTEVGTTINVKWKVGDQIALVHNGVVDVAEVKTVDNVTGKATIEADINGSPTDNDDVYLAYPADAVYSATPYKTFHFTPNPDIFDKVKNYQDGTLAYIQNNLDLRTGDGKLAVSGDKVTLKESVSIPSLICIWKLTLQDESSNPLSATQLTFKNETYTQAKATSAAKSEYYLCVVPGYIPAPAGTYSFEATVGSDTYTFSKTDLSLTAGKYYQSTVKMAAPAPSYTMAAAATTSDKGKLICTAGHIHVYGEDAACTAGRVAKIIYVGTNGHATYNHGLALALEDMSTKLTWDNSGANNDSKTAAEWCSAWNTSTPVTDAEWLLASKDQWSNMISAAGSYTTLRDGFKSVGGSNMKTDHYWSSTEDGTDYAWDYYFSYINIDGRWYSSFKNSNNFNVRACLAF